MARLMGGPHSPGRIDTAGGLGWVETKTGLQLSESQRAPLTRRFPFKVIVITGGPGVGKTTLVNSILRSFAQKAPRVPLCPHRQGGQETLRINGHGSPDHPSPAGVRSATFGFKRGTENPLETDLLVVDESSMVDIVLVNRLAAVPDHAALIIVGDVDQLPSVGPGAVLADIIASGVVPTVRLTEIFRQAAASQIIVNAHRINRGRCLSASGGTELTDFYCIPAETPEEIHRKLMQVVTERIPKRFGLHPVNEIQVLSPMNRGGLGVTSLNVELQPLLNPAANRVSPASAPPCAPGDKVIQPVNNYTREVFNGDIGRVPRINPEESIASSISTAEKWSTSLANWTNCPLPMPPLFTKARARNIPSWSFPWPCSITCSWSAICSTPA